MPDAKTFGGGATLCANVLTDLQMIAHIEDTLHAEMLFRHVRNAPMLVATVNIVPLFDGEILAFADILDDGTATYEIQLDGVPLVGSLSESDRVGSNLMRKIYTGFGPVTAGAHVLTLVMTVGVNVPLYNAKLIGVAITCA